MSENERSKGSVLLTILAGVVFLSAVECAVCRADGPENAGPQVHQEQAAAPLDVFSIGKTRLKAGERMEDARAKAVADAEREALLEGAKQLIHPTVFFREREHLLKALFAKKDSLFLEPGLIIEEWTEADTHMVRMSVRISRERMENVLMKYVASRRIIATVSGDLDGKPAKGHVLGSALSAAARRTGYRVIYLGEVADKKTLALARAFRTGDREAGKALGLYVLAAAMIEGRVSTTYSEVTREIYSSRAEGNLRVTKIGGEPAHFAVKDVKGFGSNERKAGVDAMEKASVILSSKSVKSLSGRQKKA
jgi:hypothetical protein